MPDLTDLLATTLAFKSFGISVLASIAVVTQLLIVAIIVALIAWRVSPGARAALAGPRDAIGRYGVWMAWFVATFAMLSSLWLSEVKHFVPCHLCWLQRYFMYPLSVVLIGVALAKRWWLTLAAIVIPLIGAGISAWHMYIEANPEVETCSKSAPCSFKWVDEFGYVTIPTMAGTAFVLIILLLAIAGMSQRSARRAQDEAAPAPAELS